MGINTTIRWLLWKWVMETGIDSNHHPFNSPRNGYPMIFIGIWMGYFFPWSEACPFSGTFTPPSTMAAPITRLPFGWPKPVPIASRKKRQPTCYRSQVHRCCGWIRANCGCLDGWWMERPCHFSLWHSCLPLSWQICKFRAAGCKRKLCSEQLWFLDAGDLTKLHHSTEGFTGLRNGNGQMLKKCEERTWWFRPFWYWLFGV